ncbi:hypothetical protein OSB04_002116 [Centaurea solstitialis]|uniref:Uncharacterized protein n=1 Tax=Centaurea solstitialis TaxID=347529 RepID=A0AA38WT11_9ASTR|nr:hypothetical protein OSB04_002116 [Centaurea solstitialis]
MGFPILFLFLSSIFISDLHLITSQTDFWSRACGDSGNYTQISAYKQNLDDLLYALIETNNGFGFYKFTSGQANAAALCRGDVDPNTCRRCVDDATRRLIHDCPYQVEAMGWFDACFLRYSTQSMGYGGDSIFHASWSNRSVSDSSYEQWNELLPILMGRLRKEAAAGDHLRKYASGNVTAPVLSTIYAIMQCSPDLSATGCDDCLAYASRTILPYINGSLFYRGRYYLPGCVVRYDERLFFNSTWYPATPPSSPLPRPGKLSLEHPNIYIENHMVVTRPSLSQHKLPTDKTNNTPITVIAIVASLSLVILAVLFIYVFIRRKRKLEGQPSRNFVSEDIDIKEIITAESLQYSFGIIREATNDFAENNKLGQGGFGLVYKGKLQNGKEIAVKRLSRNSGQGEQEFKNEVLLLARLQHRNLVRLLGFSIEGYERLLMYEFVENASLDQFIFDPIKRATLDWETRHKIIQGVARGLLYLHEDSRLKIIHRDMKASNVLLDAQMNPKIADFGMARLFTPEETQGNTNRIVGTYGYMAPEYVMHGKFSVKSDVFSFGVLVLEIVTGHKNNSFQNEMVSEDLLTHAWKSWKAETTSSLIDPTLIMKDGPMSLRDMIRCIHIGLLCVQEDAAERPTMASVVLMLSSLSITLALPSEPAFFLQTSMNPKKPLFEEHTSSTNNSSDSKNKYKSSPASIARDISLYDIYSR